MSRRTPRSTRTDTLFPYTTFFRSPFVDRPVQVGPFAPHLYVGLIQTPARIKAAPPEPAETLLHLRRVALHPAIDRRMIDIDPTLGQNFLAVTVADAVSNINAHRPSDSSDERRVGTECVSKCRLW